MANYTNNLRITLAEVARIVFLDQVNNEIKEVAEVIMPYEQFKNMNDFMNKIIQDHEEKLESQLEVNKGMN